VHKFAYSTHISVTKATWAVEIQGVKLLRTNEYLWVRRGSILCLILPEDRLALIATYKQNVNKHQSWSTRLCSQEKEKKRRKMKIGVSLYDTFFLYVCIYVYKKSWNNYLFVFIYRYTAIQSVTERSYQVFFFEKYVFLWKMFHTEVVEF